MNVLRKFFLASTVLFVSTGYTSLSHIPEALETYWNNRFASSILDLYPLETPLLL
jgi:hypothetical protein